jgi:hypothetical protein
MSSSMRVIGFVPPDAQWQKMADVWFACTAADIAVPAEVDAFFEEGPPDPHGMEIDLTHKAREWEPPPGWPAHGMEIDVAKIPQKAKVVRFYVSG